MADISCALLVRLSCLQAFVSPAHLQPLDPTSDCWQIWELTCYSATSDAAHALGRAGFPLSCRAFDPLERTTNHCSACNMPVSREKLGGVIGLLSSLEGRDISLPLEMPSCETLQDGVRRTLCKFDYLRDVQNDVIISLSCLLRAHPCGPELARLARKLDASRVRTEISGSRLMKIENGGSLTISITFCSSQCR